MVHSVLTNITWVIFFVLASFINTKVNYPTVNISNQDAAINFRSNVLNPLSLGLKRALADIFWIRTLMESDTEHYKVKDLNSWLYLRFKTISELDSKFYENYYYGSQYLMIVKDDLLGSESLLKRGLLEYPKDVGLNWQIGYLYGIEHGEPQKAMPYFEIIKYNPNRPKLFDSLYTKFSANTFGLQDVYDYALSVWKNHNDGEPIKERLHTQLYSIKATIDLECLNNKRTECSKLDFDNNPYLYESGKWVSSKPIINLKLNHLKD